jgi:hypothetical protein
MIFAIFGKTLKQNTMKNSMLILLFIVIFISCKKNDTQSVIFPMIINDSIDLNSDHKVDFVIRQTEIHTDDVPSSAGSIINSIDPINGNLVLYRDPVGYLFMGLNDTIKKQDNNNKVWFEYEANVIHINRIYDSWDPYWTVMSETFPPYFLAFKLISNGQEEIGWLQLEFDLETGAVSIIKGVITNSDNLIIQI